MSKTDIKPVFEQFRQLSASTRGVDAQVALRRLADWFEADGIGLTRFDAVEPDLAFFPRREAPPVYPWQSQPELATRIESALAAEVVRDDTAEWLITQAWQPGETNPTWAWVYRLKGRSFAEVDALLWPSASRLLLRRRPRAAAEGDAQAEQRQRLELAAAVTSRLSHDIGNYLTGMMGFTELSLLHVDAGSPAHRFMHEVLEAAKQGADWLRRLHLFCRRSALPGWPTLVATVLAEEEARLRSTGTPGLLWQADVPRELPLVALDVASLRTVLAELVENAREASRNQGVLRFTAREVELTLPECHDLLGAAAAGRYVELTVADDGPGFTPETRAKLFREFFYSSKPKKRGLGFLVIYGILQRSGGALRLEARPEGSGACVQLYLPIAPLGDAAPSSPEAPQVLLVQADPHLLESMRRVLEMAGHGVRAVDSAHAALDAYAAPRESSAVVILDAHAPAPLGLDLARRILSHDPKASFLFLQGSSSLHALAEEELLRRFPPHPWPTDPRRFLQAVETALTPADELE